jgi:hypothetical protein
MPIKIIMRVKSTIIGCSPPYRYNNIDSIRLLQYIKIYGEKAKAVSKS